MNSPITWSRSLRVIHWLVALGVLLNQLVLEAGETLHRWTGYCLLALITLRIFWGLGDSGPGSFRRWPLQWTELITFFKTHFLVVEQRYQVHNPLASYVYLSIWSMIAILGLTGWMMGLDIFWGEEWLEELHHGAANALVFMIIVHLSGIIVDSILFKRKAWLVMFTGRKE